MDEKKQINVCERCESPGCQVTAWVEINGDKLLDGDGPTDSVWCPTCETHDTELASVTVSGPYFLMNSNSDVVDVLGESFETFADAMEAASELVLHVWPDPEVCEIVTMHKNDGAYPTVARVTRTAGSGTKPRVRMTPTALLPIWLAEEEG